MYIFIICLLHWHMCSIHWPGVVLCTHIVPYNEIISLLYLLLSLHQFSSLIYERLHMVELDNCSILQLEHLVESRPSRVHDLFSVRNLSMSGHEPRDRRALSPAWSERNSSIQKDSVSPVTCDHQGLWMSGQASLGSMLRGHGTKTWSHPGKNLRSTNRVRSWSRLSKTSNAIWIWRMTPTVLSTKLRIIQWWNPDYMSGLVFMTRMHDDFECSSLRDYVCTKSDLAYEQNPYWYRE
jgi:hypothetical protein